VVPYYAVPQLANSFEAVVDLFSPSFWEAVDDPRKGRRRRDDDKRSMRRSSAIEASKTQKLKTV
jgi:hypothetical protein